MNDFNVPYARHYNPRFVYFLTTFWKPKTFFQRGFFRTFSPYVWLVFKSSFWSRVGYSGACTVVSKKMTRNGHKMTNRSYCDIHIESHYFASFSFQGYFLQSYNDTLMYIGFRPIWSICWCGDSTQQPKCLLNF